LLTDGERSSAEPLPGRLSLPDGLAVNDKGQAPPQFVNHSPRDHANILQRYRSVLAGTFKSPKGIFLFDDVSFPEQGKHSAGVPRQSGGASGKKANCQVAVATALTGTAVTGWGPAGCPTPRG
jgi:SRSO17 transposase